MDHSDQIKQNLEILGLDSLDRLSLEQLSDAISKNLPSGLSDNRILNIYTMWLHSHLMVIDVSADGAVYKAITGWYDYLVALGNEDWAIADAFDSWQRGEALADPTSSRRLNIARAELLSLMPPSSASSDSATDSQEPDGSFGHMHPDRLRMSRQTPEIIELDDDDDDGVVVWDKKPHQCSGKGKQPNLHFLTGSNKLVLNGNPRARASDGGSKISKSHGNPSLDGYVCNRCGLKGHDIRECPTNLDPTFDKAPPVDYECHFCGALGHHYGPLCPKHPDKNSIIRQRHRLAVELGWTDSYRPDSPEGNIGGSRSKLHRGDKWAPAGGVADKLVGDKWSPAHGVANKLVGDKWSPARGVADKAVGDRWSPTYGVADKHLGDRLHRPDEPTDRRTSRPRGPEGKRRVSRSPSPNGITRRQKKKQKTRPKTEAGFWFSKPGAVPREDFVRREKSRADEGRLSYHDEADDDPQSPPPESQVSGSPGEGKMEVDDLQPRPTSETARGVVAAIEDEWFDLGLSEMIRTESTKTDLLILIDGVEHIPPCAPAVVKLFEGRENIFANEALGKARPRPTDFYELRDGGEQEVEKMDCESVHDQPAVTEAEVFVAAVDRLASCPASGGGDDGRMDGLEPSAVATSPPQAGLVILARASLQTEAAPSNQMGTDSVGIGAVPDQLDDKLTVEGITKLDTTEGVRGEALENDVMSCEVGPAAASLQETSTFPAGQSHDDTSMEVENCAAPPSVPGGNAADTDMADPEASPGAGEMPNSDSTSGEISPMTDPQTSPCSGLSEETVDSEMTSFESSPAAGNPTSPCRIPGEALGSETAHGGCLAETEKSTSPQQNLVKEILDPEVVVPKVSPAPEISACQDIGVMTPASETVRSGDFPVDQNPTVPCQSETLDSGGMDVGTSFAVKAPTPACQNVAEVTTLGNPDKVVDPLLALLDAASIDENPPVPGPGQGTQPFTVVQVLLAEEMTTPGPGQDAVPPKDVRVVLPEESPGQEPESAKIVLGARAESSPGDEAPSEPAPGPEASQAMVG